MSHRWPKPETYRTDYTTERTCSRCGMIKITHHEGDGFPWIEWVSRTGQKIDSKRTPPCEPPAREE